MDGWIGRYIKVRGDPTPQVDLEGGWGYVCVVSIVFLEWWGGYRNEFSGYEGIYR